MIHGDLLGLSIKLNKKSFVIWSVGQNMNDVSAKFNDLAPHSSAGGLFFRGSGNPALTVAGQRWIRTNLPLKNEILSCRLDTTI